MSSMAEPLVPTSVLPYAVMGPAVPLSLTNAFLLLTAPG